MGSVLVFGSANADLVFPVPSLPAPGHTVLGEAWSALPGGKGANQAVAAARDDATTAFAGAVGRDALAGVASGAMRESGVDLARLAVVEAPTGAACICVDRDGRNQIAVAPGANALARATQVEEAALGPDTLLLLQMEVPVPEMAALIGRARRRGARVVLNLAPPGDLPPETLRALDLLIVNEHEAAWLAQRLGCGAAAAALHAALGIDVAVTLGEAGAEAATVGGPLRQAIFPATAVDTTGAGDCWCGVLAAALSRGAPLAAAMRRAAAAASLAVGRPGAAQAMPWAAETDALLAAG
ncbi:PfkB family carbohydrate kinase [Roseomonas sp. OT10]|uniref:PfkB family carbohydrate kinase n=1 Tax=Roseomonas cutis TaxID=2897332 RepID=UPI001E52C0A7|nr:PfkB family carbohydrate kinase [Roseomonas sp. OT10]UFN50548.1 PfkB family carbohydrate kinase [Roseomonas sp. OT10]